MFRPLHFLRGKKEEKREEKPSVPKLGPWFLMRDYPFLGAHCSWDLYRERLEIGEFAVACAVLTDPSFLPDKKEIDSIALAAHDYEPQRSAGLASCIYTQAIRLPQTMNETHNGLSMVEKLNKIAAGLLRVHMGKPYNAGKDDIFLPSGYILSPSGTLFKVLDIPKDSKADSVFGSMPAVPDPFDIEERPETARALKEFFAMAQRIRPDSLSRRTADLLASLWVRIPNPGDAWHPYRSMALRIFSRVAFAGTGVMPYWQLLAEDEYLTELLREAEKQRAETPAGPDFGWSGKETRFDSPDEGFLFEIILKPEGWGV